MERQKQELKEQEVSWVAKMLYRVKPCMGLHIFIIVCGLILIAILINLLITKGN